MEPGTTNSNLALLRRLPPSFWVAAALLFILALLLAFVPLFDLLGYEFCAAISFLASLTAGPVALGYLRRRAGEQDYAFSIYFRAATLNLITLVPPLLVIGLNAIRVPNCNPGVGLLFYLLLPIPTARIWSAWGTAIGLGITRRMLGGLTYAGWWLGLAAFNVWEFWDGPQMDSYNQLIGWAAGPIFDEVVEPSAALFFSRVYSMAWAALGLALAGLIWRRPRTRRGFLTAGLLLVLVAVVWVCRPSLGFERSRSAVETVLSASTRTAHFVIHHSPDLPADKVRLLVKDHEFRLSQIQNRIGPVDLPTMHSYVFPNPETKRRLVGAGRTQYAKPWNFAMYLNGAGFPHPSLRHELVHLVGGAFGSWPFMTSARFGFWQNVGLIEGLAVAVDWPVRKFDPHTWSAAQRRLGKAPDVRSLFDPLGFWTKSARRSYILAGSFVAYLIDRQGPERFRRAYQAGTLEGVYQQAPEQLIGDYENFLDGLEVQEEVLEAARLMFSARSIFKRVCAHEIAALRSQAQGLLAKRRLPEAAQATQEILGHVPGDPNTLLLLARIRVEQQKFGKARKIYQDLLTLTDLGPARLARIGGQLGDLLASRGELEKAAAHYRHLLAAHIDDANDRLASVKLEALTSGAQREKLMDFLTRGRADARDLLELREMAARRPEWATIWYLLGRQLYNRQHFDRATPYLERAGRTGLSGPQLTAENLRLLGIAAYHQKQPARAAACFSVLVQYPRHPGELLSARDWLERLGFEQDQATYAE